MESVRGPVEVKQELERCASGHGAPLTMTRFSTSVTTGQGGPSMHGKLGRGRALGNNRAPIPTCGILVSHGGPSITMAAAGDTAQSSASAKLADTMMGDAKGDPRSSVPKSTESGSHQTSLESAQDHLSLPPVSEDGSFQESDASEIASEEEVEVEGQVQPVLHQSPLAPPKRARKGREKKKVGRPIAYKGDPNAPELTEQERRRIKRRIANRESARRVRHKRQEVLEEMQVKMEQLQGNNCCLEQRVKEAEIHKSQLSNQLAEMESKYQRTVAENERMQQEIQGLRQSLQTKMGALEEELNKRAQEAEGTVAVSAFSGAAAQEGEAYLRSKGPLDWFPSLNLDDIPVGAESWDVLNNLLREESGPAAAPVARNRALC